MQRSRIMCTTSQVYYVYISRSRLYSPLTPEQLSFGADLEPGYCPLEISISAPAETEHSLSIQFLKNSSRQDCEHDYLFKLPTPSKRSGSILQSLCRCGARANFTVPEMRFFFEWCFVINFSRVQERKTGEIRETYPGGIHSNSPI